MKVILSVLAPLTLIASIVFAVRVGERPTPQKPVEQPKLAEAPSSKATGVRVVETEAPPRLPIEQGKQPAKDLIVPIDLSKPTKDLVPDKMPEPGTKHIDLWNLVDVTIKSIVGHWDAARIGDEPIIDIDLLRPFSTDDTKIILAIKANTLFLSPNKRIQDLCVIDDFKATVNIGLTHIRVKTKCVSPNLASPNLLAGYVPRVEPYGTIPKFRIPYNSSTRDKP